MLIQFGYFGLIPRRIYIYAKWGLTLKGNLLLDKSFKNKQDAINARKEAEEKYFKPILEKYDYEKSC